MRLLNEIKAIETEYKGYKFRSRLEARWAVFFDATGIQYEYEVEGFKKGTACYLPDFYLPEEDMYVEVKPNKNNANLGIFKASCFLGDIVKNLLLLPNIPDDKDGLWFFPVLFKHPVTLTIDYSFLPIVYDERIRQISLMRDWFDPIPEDPYEHRNLFWLDKDPENAKELTRYLLTPQFVECGDVWTMGLQYENVQQAYTKARQARFEHGEKG